jgi:hypothetical protein
MQLGATHYYSAIGARAYMEADCAFEKQGIEILYNTYAHPTYPQLHGDFLSHLSSVDALFNVGHGGLRELVHEGRNFTQAGRVTDVRSD